MKPIIRHRQTEQTKVVEAAGGRYTELACTSNSTSSSEVLMAEQDSTNLASSPSPSAEYEKLVSSQILERTSFFCDSLDNLTLKKNRMKTTGPFSLKPANFDNMYPGNKEGGGGGRGTWLDTQKVFGDIHSQL
jgi:hypothetical protein